MSDTDSGGLLVQIGVTQARMERELAQVVKQMAKAAQQGEDAFQKANDNIARGANRSFGSLGQGATTATKSVQNTTGAVTNLSYQLNDIGVQLAGGQSPFLIMLQQGTQISQLFNQTGGSIKSFGSILTGAITSALNPFSLLTFAIIGVGGAAIQYFASVISGGEDANKTIAEQQKLVEGVAKVWGEAVPALQAYVDQLQRAKDVTELQAATQQRQADVLAQVTAQFDEFAKKNADIGALLYQAALNPQAPLHDLGEAYTQLAEKVENGTAKAEDFKKVADALDASSMATQLGEFGEAFRSIAGQISQATAELNKWMLQAGQASRTKFPSPGAYSGVERTNDGPIQNPGEFNLPEDGPTPEKRPSTESMYPGGTWNKPSKGSSRGANSYKDEVAGIKERTAALQASTAAQAAINPLVKDYGYAAAKAAAEQRLLADAERSKMKITPQLREDISNLAGAYADATVEAKKLAESQDEIRKRAEEWASLEKDVLGGFIKDLSSGKSAADALAGALEKIANKLLDMALDDLFKPSAGSYAGGGSMFGSLFSGIGKIFGFATGTANTGGRRGEPKGVVHGQEAVIPLPQGGKVPVTITSPNTADLQSKSTGDVHVSVPISIDATGADAAGLARVEKQVADLKRTLPGTIITTVNDGTRRRLIK